ncbi:MAG: DEAD/DEAH box helicase, partial [Halieaceae bacterium]|nr:DEAD/DEAH box helicase [Halieaceae bacterium]
MPEFSKLFGLPGSPPPNAIQRAVAGTPLTEQLLIIESETGSGKTEAALWRFAQMYEARRVDGLYFALPTRAAAVQIQERVCNFLVNLYPEATRPEPILAVPGYVRAGSVSGRL